MVRFYINQHTGWWRCKDTHHHTVYTMPAEKSHLSCEQEVLLLKDDLLAQSRQLERLRARLLP